MSRATQCAVQHPLIYSASSCDGLQRLAHCGELRAVFLGIGLCTPQALTRAVPLDIIGMLLPAEALRRASGADRLVVLLADSHAMANGFSEAAVDRRVAALEACLARMRTELRLPALEIWRASDFHGTRRFGTILRDLRGRCPAEHEYVARQLADLVYASERLGPFVKIGWALGPRRPDSRDEARFDARFEEVASADIGFTYTKPGRTARDDAPRMPPYVALHPRGRICLDTGGPTSELLEAIGSPGNNETIRGLRRYLRSLMYCYGTQVEPLRSGALEERAGELIRRLSVGRMARYA